ncbi:MAG: hemolysin family protein [Verrucomicrobiales bacterium]|nr:hemolysin family protein [Verrucomicrobiales bacterium]
MNWDAAILIALKILAVLVLVLLNGFFVAAEFALVKIRDTQLAPQIRQGHRRAKVAHLILQRLDSFLSAAQLGITLASLGLGWIGEPVFMTLLEPVFGWMNIESVSLQHALAFVIGMSAITFLHISAGEQAPKLLAIQKPLPTTLWIAYPLLWFYRLSYPFVMMLNAASQWLLRRVGLEGGAETERAYSEEELRLLFDTAQNRSGTARGRDIVLNAFDLGHRTVREVMRPRHEISAFNTGATIAECLALAERTRYSRFPLCDDGDLDKTRGVVHIKDLYALRDKAQTAADLLPLARKLIYVPETARLEKLLQLFLERKSHIAVVVDEYGGTTGIVTLENVIEALVGQIQDEFDSEKSELARVSENVWEAAGTLPVHELEKIIGTVEHDESIATASGWLTQRLGGFPKAGDTLTVGACELRVEEMDGRRVARLKITKSTPATVSS